MNKKELKMVIKEMVRESLMELFAEMHLETIVENVVNRQQPKAVIAERQKPKQVYNPEPEQPQVNRAVLKESIMKNVGVSEAEWNSIYSDIDSLPPQSNEMVNPESVSEQQLASLGLMRDYSDFIK